MCASAEEIITQSCPRFRLRPRLPQDSRAPVVRLSIHNYEHWVLSNARSCLSENLGRMLLQGFEPDPYTPLGFSPEQNRRNAHSPPAPSACAVDLLLLEY